MKSLEKLKDVIDGLFDENIRKNYKRKEVEKDLEQVYQDLEVLEILKNKSVNIKKLKLVVDVFPTLEEKEILKRYNDNFASGTKNKLTFKQYQQIREWLEENNDR